MSYFQSVRVNTFSEWDEHRPMSAPQYNDALMQDFSAAPTYINLGREKTRYFFRKN